MTSSVKDKDGRAFDPALHQSNGDGSPRINKAGLCYLKGRRKPINGKGKAQIAARRAARANPPPVKPAPDTPEVKPPAPEGLPREIAPAKPSDIVADMPPVTIDEPHPGTPAEDGTPPDPDAPYVAPDAPGAAVAPDGSVPAVPVAAADPQQAGWATLAVECYEQSGRTLIDDKEWEFAPPERAWMEGKVTAVFEKHGISPELSPEGELAVCMGVIALRRSHMPKTRAWLVGAWGWFAGLFGTRKPAPKSAPQNPPRQADNPPNQAEQAVPAA